MATGSPLASEPPIRSLAATPQARIAGVPVPNGRRTTLRSVVRTRQGRTDCSSRSRAPWPRRDQAAAVAAGPYDVVSSAEARELARRYPLLRRRPIVTDQAPAIHDGLAATPAGLPWPHPTSRQSGSRTSSPLSL